MHPAYRDVVHNKETWAVEALIQGSDYNNQVYGQKIEIGKILSISVPLNNESWKVCGKGIIPYLAMDLI